LTRFSLPQYTVVSMSRERSFSIASGIVGCAGSLLLARGVLRMPAEFIALTASTYWDYNRCQLEAMAAQKADYLCGICLILVALAYHIFKDIGLPTWPPFGSSMLTVVRRLLRCLGGPLTLVLSALPILVLLIAHKPLTSSYQFEVRKAAAVQALSSTMDDAKLSKTDFDLAIAPAAKGLLGIEPEAGELGVDFVRRYAAFLGVEIPDSVDLSELMYAPKSAP